MGWPAEGSVRHRPAPVSLGPSARSPAVGSPALTDNRDPDHESPRSWHPQLRLLLVSSSGRTAGASAAAARQRRRRLERLVKGQFYGMPERLHRQVFDVHRLIHESEFQFGISATGYW